MMVTSQFLIPTQHRHFGAGEKALKIRMKSVNSIKKLTKAMKMVAASKMAKELKALENGKLLIVDNIFLVKLDHAL